MAVNCKLDVLIIIVLPCARGNIMRSVSGQELARGCRARHVVSPGNICDLIAWCAAPAASACFISEPLLAGVIREVSLSSSVWTVIVIEVRAASGTLPFRNPYGFCTAGSIIGRPVVCVAVIGIPSGFPSSLISGIVSGGIPIIVPRCVPGAVPGSIACRILVMSKREPDV